MFHGTLLAMFRIGDSFSTHGRDRVTCAGPLTYSPICRTRVHILNRFAIPPLHAKQESDMKGKISGKRGLYQGTTLHEQRRDPLILMADDDLDYHLIVRCALEDIGFRGTLLGVMNGVQLMDHLCRRGKYEHAKIPDLIILDLNMPQKDGVSALREIKNHPLLHRIPVAVLSTSVSEMTIRLCRGLCRCFCAEKPSTFGEWTRRLEDILSAALPAFYSRVKPRSSIDVLSIDPFLTLPEQMS